MNAKDLAKELDGREYENEIPRSTAIQARESGLVVVFGFSDHMMEVRGAFRDEISADHGKNVFVDAEGFLPEPEEVAASESWQYQNRLEQAKSITPIWSAERGKPAWRYETKIPHHTFKIYDCGSLYCVGIVFSIKDL